MTTETLLQRITSRADVFQGKPIIRDLRISVEMVLSLLAQGEATDVILDDFPDLEAEDIQACLAYAHAVIAHDSLAPIQIRA
jgi:uncharacterized protein (DUF433 family)